MLFFSASDKCLKSRPAAFSRRESFSSFSSSFQSDSLLDFHHQNKLFIHLYTNHNTHIHVAANHNVRAILFQVSSFHLFLSRILFHCFQIHDQASLSLVHIHFHAFVKKLSSLDVCVGVCVGEEDGVCADVDDGFTILSCKS